jgi:hypothetical protein
MRRISPGQKCLWFSQIYDAHTIAASRRLAPLKKRIFIEINQPKSKSTINTTPHPKSNLIQPNQTSKFSTLIRKKPSHPAHISIFEHRPLSLTPRFQRVGQGGAPMHPQIFSLPAFPFPRYSAKSLSLILTCDVVTM